MAVKRSRREFLKGAGAAGVWLSLSRSSRLSASPNEKLNVACIGVGGRGAGNLEGVKGENVVALCDVDRNSLEKAAAKVPSARLYDDFRKMLEQKDVEAVTVSTPDHLHAPASVAAMKLGKHVYCEKPLTHSVYEARIMRETAARQKVATQMGTQGHAREKLRRVVEFVRAGTLGVVREVHVWSNRPIWPQGIDRPAGTPPVPPTLNWDLWLGPAPERPYHPAYHPFKWRGWWDFGTGALGDMACHLMDPAFWALDLGLPRTVSAEGPRAHAETAPVWSTIHYEFDARGDRPPVALTWYDGTRGRDDKGESLQNLPSTKLTPGVEKLPKNGAIFVGEKGTLLATEEGVQSYKLLPEEKFADAESLKPSLPRSPGHHAEWIAACKGGPAALSNFDYASVLTEAVLLGNVAYRAGKKIEWDGAAMKATNCPEADRFVKREYRKGWEL